MTHEKMAPRVSGRTDAAVELLFYGLILNVLKPTDNNISTNIKQTTQATTNFGYGKHALAVTVIYPQLYHPTKKHSLQPRLIKAMRC